MSEAAPIHISCGRDLRAALTREAAAAGEGVSTLARRRLRASLGLPDEPPRPKRGAAAALAETIHRAGAPARALSRDIAALTDRARSTPDTRSNAPFSETRS